MNSTPTGIHPAPTIFTQAQIEADNILHFFHYAHLPETLQATSRPFCLLAEELVNTLPRCAERSVALRKLLEAKDAAVRANVGMPTPRETTFLDRLVTERNEVQTRLEGLTKFLDAPKKPEVNAFQYGMLFNQAQAMRNYVDILNARIDDLLEVPPANPDDIEDATVEEIGNHDIDRDGPIPFNG